MPPLSLINSSASLSNSKVVTPGLITLATSPKVLETNKALSRINSISSAVFGIIMYCKFYFVPLEIGLGSVGKSNYFNFSYSGFAMILNSSALDTKNLFSTFIFDN